MSVLFGVRKSELAKVTNGVFYVIFGVNSGLILTQHFVDGIFLFLFLSSFGKRSAGSLRRGCECIVLEPSEMIVVSSNFYFSYTATQSPDAPHIYINLT